MQPVGIKQVPDLIAFADEAPEFDQRIGHLVGGLPVEDVENFVLTRRAGEVESPSGSGSSSQKVRANALAKVNPFWPGC
jgi:hypothetical protein